MSRCPKLAFTVMMFPVSLFTASAADAVESVAYRLTDGNTMHFNDPTLAQQHLATVEKLGCEVSQDQHAGHIDISYRATYWKSLDLANPILASQWETWLKAAGFETMKGEPIPAEARNAARRYYANRETELQGTQRQMDRPQRGVDSRQSSHEQVAYRLTSWKTQHFDDAAQFEEFVALMKAFGGEVQTTSHEGHRDVRVRCAEWKRVSLPTHAIAQSWETWLAAQGFEVRHVHMP